MKVCATAHGHECTETSAEKAKLPVLNVERVADWLQMLIYAQRHRGVTIKSVASAASAAGPNLSVFLARRGKSKNVKVDKLEQMLLKLGVHRDGLLTPGLHRWDMIRQAEEELPPGVTLRPELATLVELIRINCHDLPKSVCACLTWKGGEPDDAVAFILLRPSQSTSVIIRVDRCEVIELGSRLRHCMADLQVSDAEGAELQSVWHTPGHEWIVGRKIEHFLQLAEPRSVLTA